MTNEQLANEAVTSSAHIVFIQDKPFALAGQGEIMRRQLRDEIEIMMDDEEIGIDEACELVIAKLHTIDDMRWWKRNGMFIRFADSEEFTEIELNTAGFLLLRDS